MKLSKFFISFFVSLLILSLSLQLYETLFLSEEPFDNEIKNHLWSIVNIKSERINDYILERKRDSTVLVEFSEVKEALKSKFIFGNEKIIENLDKNLEILGKQINIYLAKYPSLTLSDLQNSDEFKSLILKDLGEKSTMVVIDQNNKVTLSSNPSFIGLDYSQVNIGFYNKIIDTAVQTSDGSKIRIGAVMFPEEFVVLNDVRFDLKNTLKRFKDIGDYENLILISKEGFVIYQAKPTFDLSRNLNFDKDSTLSKVYFNKDSFSFDAPNRVSVVGPYYDENSINDNLLISFKNQVFDNGELIGTLILVTNMDKVNEITNEEINLGDKAESYIIDRNKYLITAIKGKELDLLIQEIETQSSQDCYVDLNGGVNFNFINYEGNQVMGSFKYVREMDWCLISEVGQIDVFQSSKEQKLFKDIIFIILVNTTLFLVLISLKNSYKGYNLEFRESREKIRNLFIVGLVLFLVSRLLNILLYWDVSVFKFSLASNLILIFGLFGIILMFYAIKLFGGNKK